MRKVAHAHDPPTRGAAEVCERTWRFVYTILNNTEYMRNDLIIIQCFLCNVSFLSSALYATCSYYALLYMQRSLSFSTSYAKCA